MTKEARLFNKHPSFVVRESEPFNAEPPAELLRASFITPLELCYVRNHASVPEVAAESFRLQIDGAVKRELSLSLEELRREFAAHTTVATLQCAGNRRDELLKVKPIPGEVEWSAEATSTARWTGARLGDVLKKAEVKDEAKHVAFLGLDEVEKHGNRFNFGGSIPLDKAIGEDVLLAYEMNGETLAPVHGFPLRVVVPGYIGARSVKWLSRITPQAQPSDNYYQQHAYKLFPSHISKENVDWTQGEMLGENFVTSAISTPTNDMTFPAGEINVRGYALAAGMNTIKNVEISLDDGATWRKAELQNESSNAAQAGAWCLWQTKIELKKGSHTIIARACDTAGNTQPREVASVWNFKGYMNNAWHRVCFTVE